MIYLIIGYMWIYIHRPFEVWPWLGDLHLERVYMVVMILFWLGFVSKKMPKNRMNIGIAFILISICFSVFSSNCASFTSISFQNWIKLLLFYVIVVTSVREDRHLKMLIVSFVAIMGVYELDSLREYFNGRGVYRMGIWRMVGVDTLLGDPNSFAASVNYGIPMLLPVVSLVNKKWQYKVLLALFLLAITCIILTGSRSGFVGLALLIICIGIFSKYRSKLIPLFLVAAFIVWHYIPAALHGRFLTLLDPTMGPINAQESADSRMKFFNMAFDVWYEYPLFGVGPGCFSQVTGTGMQSHSLYAQVISNLGSVGVVAVFILVSCFIFNFIEGRKIYLKVGREDDAKFFYFTLVASTVGVLQLLFLGLAGHNLFRYTWLWYGAFSLLSLNALKSKGGSV